MHSIKIIVIKPATNETIWTKWGCEIAPRARFVASHLIILCSLFTHAVQSNHRQLLILARYYSFTTDISLFPHYYSLLPNRGHATSPRGSLSRTDWLRYTCNVPRGPALQARSASCSSVARVSRRCIPWIARGADPRGSRRCRWGCRPSQPCTPIGRPAPRKSVDRQNRTDWSVARLERSVSPARSTTHTHPR